MKKYILTALLAIVGVSFAQEETNQEEIKPITKAEKFNAFFNYQASFDAVKANEDADLETKFKARQLRLEFRGKLTDKLGYRFRHRLNKGTAGQSLDGLAKATDLMYVTYQASDIIGMTLGKQCQTWGGMEFDTNPMNIYEYSDFIDNMDNFMMGANFNFKLDKNNELNFQVTDSRNTKFAETYPVAKYPIITKFEESTSPLTYILNWNANLFDGKFQTRWAGGLETQAKDKYSKMVTIGNKINLSNFQFAFDYMMAIQDIDRLGYASGAASAGLAEDVTYNSLIFKADYQPNEEWNVFAKYMYETASIDKTGFDDNFRKSQGYFVGIEHIPFKSEDLRFFLTYIGRGLDVKGTDLTSSNRVSLGMMYRVKFF